MHKLRHFYYQNKEKIWKVILIVAFVLGIIYLLNSFAIDIANRGVSETQRNDSYHYSESENTYIQGSSSISGESITQTEANKINATVSKFLDNCQNEKYEEAYDMLSNDCKEIKYDTLEKFTQQYAKQKFSKTQTYSIQKWEANTYKVEISEDILATGNANNSQNILEYITIVNQDGVNKLNINEYIGRREINKTDTQNNIKITVVSKQIYMDYEIYEIKIENHSNKTIKLDSLKNTDSIYLKDDNGNKFKAHKNELIEQELVINSGMTFTMNIKFANTYTIGRKIEKIIFEDVILDYDTYKKLESTDNFDDMYEFEMSL